MTDFYKSLVFPLVFLIFSIPASVIDIKHKRIPNRIVLPGIFILAWLRIFIFGDPLSILAVKIIAGPVLFIIVYLLTDGKLGMGDIKYSALMGIFIGLPGLFVAIGLSSIMGLIFAVIGLFSGRINAKTKIPFAPFLTLGSFLTFFIFYTII